MQVYTKILIGMLVGALIGLFLGPTSALLEQDLYQVSQWQRLNVYLDRDDPNTELELPPSGDGACGASAGPRAELDLKILEVVRGPHVDDDGTRHDVPQWSRVRLKYAEQLALRDRDQTLKRRLGDPNVGDPVEVWIEHELTELESGGVLVWPAPVSSVGDRIITWLAPIGTAFLRLIKMVIVPLVFSSLVVGVASLGDLRRLGRLGARTLAIYMMTTAIAVSIGVAMAKIVRPGTFIDERSRVALQAQFQGDAGCKVEDAAASPSMIDNLLNIIPVNPAQSLVNEDMLQVIFFALIFGVALTFLPNTNGRPIVTLLDRLQQAMVVIIHIVMKLAPYGVAALVAEVVGTSGFSVLKGLLVYGLCVIAALFLHATLVYGGLVRYVAKLPFGGFLKAIRPALLIAFSTSSSSATLPVSMECAEENLRISNPVASFVLPLGSTVNMDGTALYQGLAAIFIAQVFGMDLTLGEQLGIIATATMASIGAAGVPGAGMVTLAMVVTGVGIPAVGVALILGMDRLLDMFRTTINVTGDLSVSASMARLEGDDVRLLGKDEDRADPTRGFEGRLDRPPEPIEPE